MKALNLLVLILLTLQITAQDKTQNESLHPSIQNFSDNQVLCESKKFLIRIDVLEDRSLRYASWNKPAQMSDKPSLILNNGEMQYHGSMGGAMYTFKNSAWTYIIDQVAMCEDPKDCGMFLILKKNGEEVTKKRMSNLKLKEDKRKETSFLITEKSAGQFVIGEDMPKNSEHFKLYKDAIERDTEDGTVYDQIYNVLYKDNPVLILKPECDYSTGSHTNKISEIKISSPKYKTDKGIGVNSTIKEFIKAYPDYDIWYTYISDMYVIDSKSLKIQFLLDGNDYTKEIVFDSDMTILKAEDFKKGAKIKSVRLF